MIRGHELRARFHRPAPATLRRVPVLTADVPVGRPGWTLAPQCARCHAAPVLASNLCSRCYELAEAARQAKTAAEMAHVLVTR